MHERSYDVVVIGAGPVGENVADRAVRGGLTAVVVEAERVGGECSFWACMPSKALLRPVHALTAARRVAGAAEAVTGTIDAKRVFARRDSFTHSLDDTSQVQWLASAGIDLVRGRGRLDGPRRVVVEVPDGSVTVLSARHAVVLATGSVPTAPPVPGLAEARAWSSREATSATSVPPRLAVLGAGVVALEMAQAFRGLGAERVVVLSRAGTLLPRYETFVGDLVAAGLREAGVEVWFDRTASRVGRHADGTVTLTLSDGERLEVDELLVATGRRPAVDGLGLATVGLPDGGPVTVDDTLAVQGVDGGWLYAAGDVNGRVLLTHQGKYQARAVGDLIAARAAGRAADTAAWGRHVATADDAAVPQVIFTDPEVAAVGLTEQEAHDRGLRVRAVEYDLGAVAGASVHADGYTGRAKLVVDTARDVVVGATFVGQDVAELVHAATVAVVGQVPLSRLWHAVPSYPTMSEIWLRLLETWQREA